jgi:uncharacterized protein YegL
MVHVDVDGDAGENLPGGPIAARPLHFMFIADCSDSMSVNGKIQSLNAAIREAIPHMRQAARGNPNAEMLVRSIKFSTGANWHQEQPVDVQQYEWKDLQAGGTTDMGGALSLAADAMRNLPRGELARMFPPVLVLISDGLPNSEGEFEAGLKKLMDDPWGARAIRVAIGIGAEANGPGKTILSRFIGNIELKVLEANNAPDLANHIRFVSTEVANIASRPPSQPLGSSTEPNKVLTTTPPPDSTPPDPNKPW